MRPLKFLGLEYDGTADRLRARTRKGADLVFDKHDLNLAVAARERALSSGRSYRVPSTEFNTVDFFETKCEKVFRGVKSSIVKTLCKDSRFYDPKYNLSGTVRVPIPGNEEFALSQTPLYSFE